MKFKIYIIILLFLVIPLINGSGIIITNGNNVFINKTVNKEANFSFQISNNASFELYNISFKDNDYITMNTISTLNIGETREVSGKVTSNKDFDGYIELLGYYQANLGVTNDTIEIEVNFNDGLNKCDFSIVKGDTIKWINNVNDEIKLKNDVTQEDVTTILINGNYTTNFENPESFRYYFLRRGYKFTEICTITVLDDIGYVNDPNLNGKLNISIRNSYEPTKLEMSFIDTSYSMDFYRTTQGIFTLKNTGNITAKNVKISGDWFSFSPNTADIESNETIIITYTISPEIYITNNTNLTHVKNISIKGNFDELIQPINIFINYAEIEGNGTYSNFTSLIDLICLERPDLCQPKERIIYRNVNNGTSSFNVSFEQSQASQMMSLIFDSLDDTQELRNRVLELINNRSISEEQMYRDLSELKTMFEGIKSNVAETEESSVFTIIFIFLIIIVFLLIGIGIFYRRKKKTDENTRM